MRTLIIVSLLLCLPAGPALAQRRQPKARPAPQPKEQKLFPYQYAMDDLPNGLKLITVPTDYPNLVALYIVVRTGSRNEVEPGKSGYAHLFEHLMFRGSENFSAEERNAILKRAGAESNAYTTDDRTVYHEVFSKEDLNKIMELEADRFQRLQYEPGAYKTETKAVLGEFNKNSADPEEKLYEVLRSTAYKKHTYEHTTMGYLKDVEDMPNQYDYSWQFYKRYYRPENTTVIVVGDVKRDDVLAMVTKYFGGWERGNYTPEIPREPAQTAPREEKIEWPSTTLPYVTVAFRGPAYSDTEKDHAALDLVQAIAFGDNSDLYQKLVLKEQKVESLGAAFADRIDPELFFVQARVKDPKDVDYVREQILATFKRYSTELIPQSELNQTRSRILYSFALSMNSSEAIASILAPYIALRGTPETLNKWGTLLSRITPEEIRATAARYFVDRNRTIVTLTQKGKGGAE
ncbi:MAG TPA: pitrilysin family protein [Pyrinomonadaceae bacterium]